MLFEVDAARAQALVDNLNAHFGSGRAVVGSDLAVALADADGLVNTTPVGMAKLPGTPLPVELLHARLWVAEIIYFRWKPNCCALPGHWAAARWMAATWQCFRR